jgi:hypothetical protein
MKKLFLTLIGLISLLLLPSVSLAETTSNPLNMEELSIKVLPEFVFHPLDHKKKHPPLLIGYQGTLVNSLDHSSQGRIEIPLPMNEKNFQIGYVADYSSDLSKTHEIEYTVDKSKGTISWTTSEKINPQGRYKFIIEFYTDSLKVTKDKRLLDFHFKSFADIRLVSMTITQPYKATNLKLTPAPKETSHDEGANTSTYFFQNVKAGDEKSFTLSYNRQEAKPLMELINEKSASINKKNNYVMIASISGVSLLAAGTIAILLKKRKRKRDLIGD